MDTISTMEAAMKGGFIGAATLGRFGRGVWHMTHVSPPLLGWVQASQAQSVSGKTEGMMDGCAGGGEVALQITGVQKTKKEKAKILPVDGADT